MEKNKINNTPNGPLDHHSDCARQVCVGQDISEVSFVSLHHYKKKGLCTTFKGHSDLDWQLNIALAHSVEHWHDSQETLGSIPTGAMLYFSLLR